jgi:hypothetical protein
VPLPSDAVERKNIPIYSGFIAYFPHAMAEVAKLSKRGNDQHNPGCPLHWDRSKSGDELDALARHLLGTTMAENVEDELEDATAVAWRAMAHLEKLCELRDKGQNSESPKIARAKERRVWSEQEKSAYREKVELDAWRRVMQKQIYDEATQTTRKGRLL